MRILRRPTAVLLTTLSMLLIVLGVESASASATAVPFRWTMHLPPGHFFSVRYTEGLDQIESNDLVAHTGAISRATFASSDFVLLTFASSVAGRFSGTLTQKLVVGSEPLEGVVTVPVHSVVHLKNLDTGKERTFEHGTHHFSIGTGVGT
jgi:hypothetical protein